MPRYWGSLPRLDEAIARAVRSIDVRLNVMEQDLWNSVNRIVAMDIRALMDNPPFDRSAVDGFAVKFSDTIGASPTNPVRLIVKGKIRPGELPDRVGVLEHGEAVEVYTGSFIPHGADAVIMYEDVVIGNGYIEVIKPVPQWANISRRGEDFKKGDIIVYKNTVLKPWHLVAIASQGMDKVLVYEKLRFGIISIGDELIKPGSNMTLSKVYASTEYLVKTMLDNLGFIETKYYGIIRDDIVELDNALNKAFNENDCVITIAGTSVSSQDIVPDYIESHGYWVVRGIAIRPGRTTSLAIVNNKPLFLLSGNPVAAWVGIEAFIKPVIAGVLKIELDPKPVVKAILKRRVTNQTGFRSFVRVFLEKTSQGLMAEPYMIHGSSIISSLLKAHGYIVINEDTEGYDEGEEVDVVLLNPL
ncbi:molybdopterin molybdotransferase MoeA [Desulfurococcaceae archaeon MEX13E-LK6-19]|nr:molybdopterin molybdotransferase MoeA [Desulfurococcaceae archaeon MEX13E-LK6-19]